MTFQRVFSEQIPNNVQRLGQSPGQRPHGRTLGLPVHDRGSSRETLGAEPQLPREILLHHVVRKLHPEVPVRPALWYQLVHYLAAYRQHLVLTVAQLVHQGGASFRLLAAVERVQLAGDRVQSLVRVEKLSEQARVVPLQASEQALTFIRTMIISWAINLGVKYFIEVDSS